MPWYFTPLVLNSVLLYCTFTLISNCSPFYLWPTEFILYCTCAAQWVVHFHSKAYVLYCAFNAKPFYSTALLHFYSTSLLLYCTSTLLHFYSTVLVLYCTCIVLHLNSTTSTLYWTCILWFVYSTSQLSTSLVPDFSCNLRNVCPTTHMAQISKDRRDLESMS